MKGFTVMENESFIIRWRKEILLVTGIITLVSAILVTQERFNPDLKTYLPSNIPVAVNTDTINSWFRSDDRLVLVMETRDVLDTDVLSRIEGITAALRKSGMFREVISLTDAKDIRGEEGQMIVEPVVKDFPATAEETAALREKIRANEMIYRHLVSEDFRNTLVFLIPHKGIRDKDLVEGTQKVLKDFPGREGVYLNGQPYLRFEAGRNIGRDLLLLLPVGLLCMFLFLWLSFREIRGVLLPFSVVVVSTCFALALYPVFGWELSIIGVLLPIMMIAIANNYGIYFIAKYQELNALYPDITMERIASESFAYLKKPVLFCGLTTVAGVLGLVAHILKPARQMGIIAAIAIGFALLMSLFYIPSFLSHMKKGKVYYNPSDGKRGFFLSLLSKTAGFCTLHPGMVVTGFLVFMLLVSAGVGRLKTATDHHRILPDTHPYNLSLKSLNTAFGGDKILNLMFEGDIKDPRMLENLDRYAEAFKKLPETGGVTSISTVVRKMSKALNDPGETGYDRIPQSREAIAQYFELYAMNGDPEDFEAMVDFGYSRALLTVQFRAETLKEIERVSQLADSIMKTDPHLTRIGGFSLIEKEICQSVVSGQYSSLFFAFAAIFLLLSLIFRNLTAGLLGSIPLVFAVACTFGLMGWTGMELNIVTALLSSVSIGLGVDFTIQLFWKIRSEILAGNAMPVAVKTALSTIGRGIAINAFSVMLGFAVLFLSSFPVIRSFALLIMVSLFLCLASALVLIPSLCLLTRPGFLYK